MGWLRDAHFAVILCGHEHQSRSTTDLRTNQHVLATGSYGLDAATLMNRYHGIPRRESNKYQIILINPEGYSEIVFRKLREPGSPKSDWIEDDDDGPPRISIRFRRPRLDIITPGSFEQQVHLDISPPVLPEGGTRWALALKLVVPDSLRAGIRRVTYTIGNQEWRVQRREDDFATNVEIDSLDKEVQITIETECGVPTMLTREIPPPQ